MCLKAPFIKADLLLAGEQMVQPGSGVDGHCAWLVRWSDDRQQQVDHVVAAIELDIGPTRVAIGPLAKLLEGGCD